MHVLALAIELQGERSIERVVGVMLEVLGPRIRRRTEEIGTRAAADVLGPLGTVGREKKIERRVCCALRYRDGCARR